MSISRHLNDPITMTRTELNNLINALMNRDPVLAFLLRKANGSPESQDGDDDGSPEE